MARKKRDTHESDPAVNAIITDQPITETIEKNYMPYAMSVIISRAIPEIDGFKPSHRKLLYTMYKMGLMSGHRTKSTNVVGETMKLNPHGDAAIYETMVRLTRGNEALLHPFIDSKGTFGKQYSSDMAYAASRYTEVKLDPFCAEIFRGIDKNAVEMIDNYDGTMKEPALLPVSFPNILLSPNLGIGVSLASRICSFNLGELCDGAIQLLHNPYTTSDQLLDIIKAPDFSGGAYLIYDRDKLREIYETGLGSFKMRAKYVYNKADSCIEVLEIPYSTSLEAIMKRLADLSKEGKLREVTDFRDEIDLNGFKLTLDIKRGTDPDKLMNRLYKLTPLEDSFSCNFNVLIDNAPRQLGVGALLNEWIKFRMKCVRGELTFELARKNEKLHLLMGLGKIVLDIDKAIEIIRNTEHESDVVPNLMKGFDITEAQAEYIAEIKLRYLNREYIAQRLTEIDKLQEEIEELNELLSNEKKLKSYIAKQLKEIKRKYGKPRRTELIYADELPDNDDSDEEENIGVYLIATSEGYVKKLPTNPRAGEAQKLKEGDEIVISEPQRNNSELIFFTDRAQVYKAHLSDFEQTKSSALGEYAPAKLGFDEGERVMLTVPVNDFEAAGNVIFIFENGKGIRVPLSAYQTKNNRRKLANAYSDTSPLVAALYEGRAGELSLLLETDSARGAIIKSSLIPVKSTRDSNGVTLLTVKPGVKLAGVTVSPDEIAFKKLVKTKIPAIPAVMQLKI